MSDNGEREQPQSPEMPNFIPSSIVAIATVFPVLLLLVVIFLCATLNKRCFKNQRTENNQDTEQRPPGGAEMLREDTVVIHDVGFPDEAYHPVRGKPEPSPSIFQDDVFLQEVLTVADVYSPTRAILNCNYEPDSTLGGSFNKVEDYFIVNEILEEILDDIIEEEVKIYVNVKRNPSYREAINRGLDFHVVSVGDQEEFSIMSSLKSIDLHSNDSIQDFVNSTNVTSFVDTPKLLRSDIKMCEDQIKDDISVTDLTISSPSKWRSTPILDLDNKTRSSGLERKTDDSRSKSGNKTNLMGSESRSYSPVYKLGHHGSFDTSLFSRSSFLQSSNE